MPSGKLTLPNGTILTVEGTTEEVGSLIKLFSEPETHSVRDVVVKKPTDPPKKSRQRKEASGPLGYIRGLKEEGYFGSKRTISDVQEKLEEKGHIYPLTSLSTPLIRLVRSRDLRRLKEAGLWKYVNR